MNQDTLNLIVFFLCFSISSILVWMATTFNRERKKIVKENTRPAPKFKKGDRVVYDLNYIGFNKTLSGIIEEVEVSNLFGYKYIFRYQIIYKFGTKEIGKLKIYSCDEHSLSLQKHTPKNHSLTNIFQKND